MENFTKEEIESLQEIEIKMIENYNMENLTKEEIKSLQAMKKKIIQQKHDSFKMFLNEIEIINNIRKNYDISKSKLIRDFMNMVDPDLSKKLEYSYYMHTAYKLKKNEFLFTELEKVKLEALFRPYMFLNSSFINGIESITQCLNSNIEDMEEAYNEAKKILTYEEGKYSMALA
jgi:hypothetical protein